MRPLVRARCGSARRRTPAGAARPVSELRDEAGTFEVAQAIAKKRFRVADRTVVDARPNLFEDELEQKSSLQLAELLFQLLVEISAQRGEDLDPGVVGERDRHAWLRTVR